jgi:RAB protein geranylgeranyltransferase component A
MLRVTEEAITLTTAVEENQKMSLEEKQALKSLLEKYLIEERRKEIYQHGEESKATVHERFHKFGSDVNRLKRMMDNVHGSMECMPLRRGSAWGWFCLSTS